MNACTNKMRHLSLISFRLNKLSMNYLLNEDEIE